MPPAGASIDTAPRFEPRLALERVVAGLDRGDHERRCDRDERRLHDAAVAIILRLVVLLAAEARGLLTGDLPTTIHDELEQRAANHHDGEAALLRRHDAWPRLLDHRHALPARGGALFDLDLPLDDLALLLLLRALPRAPCVEQLGAFHEALLDHAVARVDVTTLGLRGVRRAAPDVPLSLLEQLATAPDTLVAQLQALTGRSATALDRALRHPAPDSGRLLRACAGDGALLARIRPWAGLLRRDADDRPHIFLAGGLRIVASGERRSTGSHYTPRALADAIVRHTLDPLCHIGPAEGVPPARWQRRPPAEILELRICDLAMGCGAFLLAACRYLAAQLLAGWDAGLDADAAPQGPDRREQHAMRLALRCLYGVDRSPTAVDLARLSLWLATASPHAPVDVQGPSLHVGDALLGLVDHHEPAALRRLLAAGDPARLAELTARADAITVAALRPHDRHPATASTPLGHHPDGAPRQPLHWPLVFPEVLLREPPGFDAILGNPPFQGGQKLGRALGLDYRDYLVKHIARGRRGSADLCAYFFLRAAALLRTPGQIGLLATSTIAQGDTREVGLDQLCAGGLEVVRASASEPWPGAARLAVAQVWLRRGPWGGERILGGAPVPAISSALHPARSPADGRAGRPQRLRANVGRSFIGCYVLGLGFVLRPDEARALIARDPRNREVLCPYLSGDDLTRAVDQSPSRWIINFRDWPLARAESYADCLARVHERVKPQRDRVRFSTHARAHWWQYERPRVELHAAAARARLLLACARVAKYLHFVRIPTDLVPSEQLVLVTTDCPSTQAVLQSAVHEAWTLQHASTLDTRRRYTPSDCLDTFPMPATARHLADLADRHDAHRRAVMQMHRLGLTRTYNRVHDPDERDPAVAALRGLHVELDRGVADAYGWSDLELGHDFHATAEGRRFTISAVARRALQERLLALNHARHADERAARSASVRDIADRYPGDPAHS